MRSNPLKALVVLLGTVIFSALLLCQPGSSRAKEEPQSRRSAGLPNCPCRGEHRHPWCASIFRFW